MRNFGKILVANRGEIAVRIIRTLSEMGIGSVAVYSDVDAGALHTLCADEKVGLGAPRSYLDTQLILEAAAKVGADAIHPGYGFLSENPAFARACTEAGLVFVGPSPEAIEAFGDKRQARQLAERAGVPVVPGARECDSPEQAASLASELGFPVLLKAAAGGGGKGMRKVSGADELIDAFAGASREARGAFGDARLLIEKYIYPARHIEVQVLGDGRETVAVGERECSLQRRYQKVVEESPAISISEATRHQLHVCATKLLREVGYAGAGTVEFLVGPNEDFYFLEVNTRLQVEHPVTEMVHGIDLVKAQVEIAGGASLPTVPPARGHAIEVRLNAEDAYGGFIPATGEVLMLRWPHWPSLRIDAGLREGTVVTPDYDSMLAKVIAWGQDREEARRRLIRGLSNTTLLGLVSNQGFLVDVLQRDFFVRNETFTTTLEEKIWTAPEVPEVARLAAQRVMGPRLSTIESSFGVDAHSPWSTLGAFRMG